MAKLAAKKPEQIRKNSRVKMLLFGEAGVGKSTAATQFPNAFFVDTERGVEQHSYTEALTRNNSDVFQSADYDEILEQIRALISEKHDYRTLVIDPFTNVYQDLLDRLETAGLPDGRSPLGWPWSDANRMCKRMFNLILNSLDLNVIVSCHSKKVFDSKDEYTFDGWKKLDYVFDLVLHLQRQGNKRVAFVVKTRIPAFADGERFAWSYEAFEQRYGKDIGAASEQVVLATEQQCTQLHQLMAAAKISSKQLDNWLNKAKVTCVEDLPEEVMLKCLKFCEDRIPY